MSLNPIPSSSVGSKSTNAHLGGRGRGRGEGGSFHHHDERSGTLCSSWISRLHPPIARQQLRATADTDAPLDLCDGVFSHREHAISTDKSHTPTSISNLNSSFVTGRYLNPFEGRSVGVPLPRFAYGDGGDRLVSGFGPFRFRSQNSSLPRGQGSLGGRDIGGERVLGRGNYGEGGGFFPPFRRMARLGGGSDGERGMVGSRVGRQLESVHAKEQLGQGNVFFRSRRASDVQSQVKLSPFFKFRPLLNCGYSIDKNKGIIGHPVDDGRTKILENRGQMRPASNENCHRPLSISYFPSREVVDDFSSCRRHERHFAVDPWHASSSVQHVAGRRGTYYRDGAYEAAPIRTSCNMAINNLERTPVCMNEPKEPSEFWNMGMGRLKRHNTSSSVSQTISLTSNLSMKRSAKSDGSDLPAKFRKLGN